MDLPTTVVRKYWTFTNPNRILHQSVNQTFDVRQFVFDNARLVNCVDGDGKVLHLNKGWLCATIMQHGEASAGAKTQQGFMSIDITGDGELQEHLFVRGGIVFNKSVSSVVGSSGPNESALLTMISENGNLQVTYVRHYLKNHGESSSGGGGCGAASTASAVCVSSLGGSGGTRGGPSAEEQQRRRQEQRHEERRKKSSSSAGGGGGGGTGGGGGGGGSGGQHSSDSANGLLRDPRLMNRQKERRPPPSSENDGESRPSSRHGAFRVDS